jgi:hypothetical protein
MQIALKLRGIRQIDAAEWMLGKPVPEEIDGEGLADWETMGVSLTGDHHLVVPTKLLADFIEEIDDAIVILGNIKDGLPSEWEEHGIIRSNIRALETIQRKLREMR